MGELLVASPFVQNSDSLKITYSQSVQEFSFVYILWEMARSSWTYSYVDLGPDAFLYGEKGFWAYIISLPVQLLVTCYQI